MTVGFKAHYFKELAELESSSFWFQGRNALILWSIARYLPNMKSFLEVGCGTGFVIAGVSREYPKADLFGSEFFEEALVFARMRVPGAIFTQMDARDIPFDEKLDAIGIFDVLEHISEDDIVLRQLYKALKPGGFVFVTVPQHRWLWSAVDEYACHVRRYSSQELHSKVSKAGFHIVRSTSFVSMLLPVMFLSRWLRRNKKGAFEADAKAKAELKVNPILNCIFGIVLFVERCLIRIGISLPVGGSRLLVARKPLN